MSLISNQKWDKFDWAWVFSLAGLVLLFHWKLLDLQIGFYSGDHRQQHYPWAFFYWHQLREGMLPWWTSLMGCGFPLLAEGQVGALYPLNYLFYRFFPFDFAYTYNILFHYVLGGGFFYLFMRHLSLSRPASFFGSLIYLFGTAQGGYYYNIISLKTLIWFPLGIVFLIHIFEKHRYIYLFWLGLVFAFQLCAGYLQYAAYSIAFTGFTALWFTIGQIRGGQISHALKAAASVLSALILGLICAAPQLGATWELSSFSNRFDFPVEFAFVGSMNPLTIATLFFPHWDGFLRAEIYFGSVGLLFFIAAIFGEKRPLLYYLLSAFVLALLLALGKFNPLYRWAVELTEFSSFRIPTKFLYFAGFYGAALCAIGVDSWQAAAESIRRKVFCVWVGISFIACAGLIATFFVLDTFRATLLGTLSSYVDKNYGHSPIHPHSAEYYQQKLRSLYEVIVQMVHPLSQENLVFISFMAASVLVIYFFRYAKSKSFFAAVFFILFANMWVYGNTSVRGNYEPKSFLLPESQITDYLKKQPGSGRLHRVFRDMAGADSLPLTTHNTMLIGQPIVGAYSPLLMKSVYQSLGDLGDVNDSNLLKTSTKEKFTAASELIDFLNIEWILSDHPFSFERYQQVVAADGAYLYKNPHTSPRATLVGANGEILSFEDKQNSVRIRLKTSGTAELVLSDIFYPGWKITLNGVSAELNRHQELFRSISIPDSGEWMVEMRYRPLWVEWTVPALFLAAALFLFPVFVFFRKSKHE